MGDPPEQQPSSEFRNLVRPRVIGLAVLFCLGQLVQELIAEAVFTQFTFPRPTFEVAMVYAWFQQAGTVLIALLSLYLVKSSSSSSSAAANNTPTTAPPAAANNIKSWLAMCTLSALIFASTVLPNLALQFVYFPAKVVSKSSKLVPTMMVSVLMGNSKSFSKTDYASAMLLITGAITFALSSSIQQPQESTTTHTHQWASYFGLMLLATAALADALVPNIQQLLMRTGQASAEHLAIKVNLIGSSCIAAYLLVRDDALQAWGEILLVDSPHSLSLMCGSGLALGVAVLAYTLLIREAGSVVAVAVATARKVLTLTLSYVVFPGGGKTFDYRHAGSALLVAFGMALGPLMARWHASKEAAAAVGGDQKV